MATDTSARGQRAGLYWQDVYTAWVILRWWTAEDTTIRAVWPEAHGSPHVDDLAIRRASVVEYRQLKHSVDPSALLTTSDLLGVDKQSGRSLIGDLCRGWRVAKSRSEGLPVHIQLVTNKSLSSDSRNKPIAPKELVRELLQPLRIEGDTFQIPESLQQTWTVLLKRTGCQDAELREFLAALELHARMQDVYDLRARLREALRRSLLRPERRLEADASALVDLAARLATSSDYARWLGPEDIEHEMSKLFGTRRPERRHLLTLPPGHVVRGQVETEILEALGETTSGYLRVLGPPGCGKTTLATSLLTRYPDLFTARYYVFDPSEGSARERDQRVASGNFVLDLLEALRQRYPGRFSPILPDDADSPEPLGELWRRLEKLGGEGKCVVLVDGIDHALRSSEVPTLLDVLRPEAQVPSGVVFLVFGQPDWPYPNVIKRSRCVEVPPFSVAEARAYFERFAWHGDDDVSDVVVSRAHDQTGGNPLSLFYTAQWLADANSATEALQRQEQGPTIGPDVWAFYGRLWDDLLHGKVFAGLPTAWLVPQLMAYLAVATLPISGENLFAAYPGELGTELASKAILERLRPVLSRHTSGGWQLFHDDLRRYLLENTEAEQRKEAHRRHALALQQVGGPTVVAHVAEHHWAAEGFDAVPAFVLSRSLAEWLVDAPAEQVLQAARLALAAAFRCGRIEGIVAAALFYARCARLVEPEREWADLLGVGSRARLQDLSRIVAPSSADTSHQAMSRREQAARLLVERFDDGPEAARELACRFLLDPGSLPKGSHYDLGQAYLGLWTRLQLLLGDSAKLVAALSDPSLSDAHGGILHGLEEAFRLEPDAGLAVAHLRPLEPVLDVCAESVLEAATWHVREDQVDVGVALLSRLERHASSLPDEALRQAFVLGLEAGVEFRVSAEAVQSASVFASPSDPMSEDVLEAAVVEGFFGRNTDPALASPPSGLVKWVRGLHGPVETALRFVWDVGTTVGLMARNPGLVRTSLTEKVARRLITGDVPGLTFRDGYVVGRIRDVALPLLVAVASRQGQHATAVHGLLAERAHGAVTDTGERNLALHRLLARHVPNVVTTAVKRALEATELPHSDGESRQEWFRLWETEAASMGVEVPRAFQLRAAVAGLSCTRKDYDVVERVLKLLARVDFESDDDYVDMLEHVAVLVARLNDEDDGDRIARSHLPEVLAELLRVSPGRFARVFEWVSDPLHGFEDPVGALPLEVVRALPRFEPDALTRFSPDDLCALWHWLSASQGAMAQSEKAAGTLLLLVEQLRSTEPSTADLLHRWTNAVGWQEDEKSEAKAASIAPEEDTDLPDADASKAQLRWLTWNLGGEHRPRALRYLAKGPAERVRLLAAVGDNLGRGACPWYREVEDAVDELLDTLAPSGETAKRCLEHSIGHLEHIVAFQPARPLPSLAASDESASVAKEIVRLVARGLWSTDAETVRRAIRALAALGARPGLASPAADAMRSVLQSSDDRLVEFGLLAVVGMGTCPAALREAVELVNHHENAVCRLLASLSLKVPAEWGPGVAVLAAPAILDAGDPGPDHKDMGAFSCFSPESVRHSLVDRLALAAGKSEHELFERLAAIEAAVPAEHESQRFPGYPPRRALPRNTVGNAAGRLARRLIAESGSKSAALVLSSVLPAEPWLVTCGPHLPAPADWVELAASRHEAREYSVEHQIRCLALRAGPKPSNEARVAPDQRARQALATLYPASPPRYFWKACCAPLGFHPPRMPSGCPVRPLCFWNTSFDSLTACGFDLAPRWWEPPFADLAFVSSGRPAFVDGAGRTVVMACFEESGFHDHHPRFPGPDGFSWATSWYADPSWLRTVVTDQPAAPVYLERHQVWRANREDEADDVTYLWTELSLHL